MNPDSLPSFDLRKALKRAYQLGQEYWRQADSESYKQNALADATEAKFDALVAETIAAHPSAAPQGAQPAEPVARIVIVPLADGRKAKVIRALDETLNSKEPWIARVPEGTLLYASPADAAPVPQEVRMLTDDEVAPILDEIIGNYPSDLAEVIQRRFAEVNGLTIPAKEPKK